MSVIGEPRLDERPADRAGGGTDAGPAAGLPEDVPEARIYVASQWRLMWWKFRKHKLAMAGAIVTAFIYLIALFVEVIAPSTPTAFSAQYPYVPPQRIHLFEDGRPVRPYVYDFTREIEAGSLRRTYTVDPTQKVELGFFVRGEPYKLWGVFAMDRHLFGPVDPTQRAYFLGADRLGRDLLSRMIYGTRISMSIGLVGVALSFGFGIMLGGLSGYYGGLLDDVIQRVIEFLRSLPTIPLWMGLAAAVPAAWSPTRVYFSMTILISVLAWTDLARVVRGRFIALREEDFVTAARLDGARERRIIFRHMLPSFSSHIIAAVTLAIPAMILAETALSFLGIGLREPAVSWGVLLQEAQNVRTVATAPWLLIPALAVIVTVLALSFTGDGLRDAADPYGR